MSCQLTGMAITSMNITFLEQNFYHWWMELPSYIYYMYIFRMYFNCVHQESNVPCVIIHTQLSLLTIPISCQIKRKWLYQQFSFYSGKPIIISVDSKTLCKRFSYHIHIPCSFARDGNPFLGVHSQIDRFLIPLKNSNLKEYDRIYSFPFNYEL